MSAPYGEMTDGTVIRVGLDISSADRFFPGPPKAESGDFALNSAEREDVKAGKPGVISVWDVAFTTPSEAYEFLPPPPRRRFAFHLPIKDILGLAYGLQVFHSPIQDERKGAYGHCDLQDLTTSRDGLTRKDIRADLVAIADRNAIVVVGQVG